jgi:hypothetical protein
VDGFSHKLPLLAGLVFRTLAALRFADEDFARVKEALVRAYANSKTKPAKHASYLRLRALRQRLWEADAVRGALEGLTPGAVRTFLPELLADTHLEALAMGNVTAGEAAAMAGAARKALGARGAGVPGDRALRLPEGASLLHRAPAANPEEENSVAEVYLQVRAFKQRAFKNRRFESRQPLGPEQLAAFLPSLGTSLALFVLLGNQPLLPSWPTTTPLLIFRCRPQQRLGSLKHAIRVDEWLQFFC